MRRRPDGARGTSGRATAGSRRSPRTPRPGPRCWSGSSSRARRPTGPTAGWRRRTRDASARPGECGWTRSENSSIPTVPWKSVAGSPRMKPQQPLDPLVAEVLDLRGVRVERLLDVVDRIGGPTLSPGLSRPPDRRSTVARSSASRSGFSQPSGMTAVPRSIRLVRCDAAASTATGEEMPYCRCRCRTHALSKPSCSPSSMISSVDSCPGAGIGPVEQADGQEAELAQRLGGQRHLSDSLSSTRHSAPPQWAATRPGTASFGPPTGRRQCRTGCSPSVSAPPSRFPRRVGLFGPDWRHVLRDPHLNAGETSPQGWAAA